MKSKNLVLIIILCVAYLLLSVKAVLHGGDFEVYLDAATKLKHYQNIYKPPFFGGLQYFYSPFFALILIPFSGHFMVSGFLWLMLIGFLFYRSTVLVMGYFDTSVLTEEERFWWGGISLFFIIRFLLYNIAMIQVTVFLLWAVLESVRMISDKKWVSGALLLALAINIKLLPLVVLPYLVYRGKYRAFAATLFFSVFYLLVPSFFLGHEFNTFMLGEWWKVINPLGKGHMIEADLQCLTGTVPVFLTGIKGKFEIRRNILFLPLDITEHIINLLRLLFTALTLFFLKSPFDEARDKLSEIRAIAYICLLVPLIFPHQQKYAFIFIYPMVIYLVYYCMVMWKYKRDMGLKLYLVPLLITSVVFTPFISSDFLGRSNYDLIHYFKALGLGTVLLGFFAFLANPVKIMRFVKSG